MPASIDTMAEYAKWLCYDRPVRDRGGMPTGTLGVSPASVRRMLASVRAAHRLAGAPVPQLEMANRVIKGYERALTDDRDPRARPRRATPLTPEMLEEMTSRGGQEKQELIRLRDAAMMYLNYTAATRVSELVRLNIEDVTVHPWGLEVTVYRVKTGAYTDVMIEEAANPQTIAAVTKWIATLALLDRTSGPLFPRIGACGEIRPGGLARGRAEQIVRQTAAAVGMEGRFTVHSGRRGFATQARLAGHDMLAIARHGGWADNSTSLAKYIEEADGRRLNPLRGAGA
jgi:integrase